MSAEVQKSLVSMGIRGVPAAHDGFETFAGRSRRGGSRTAGR